MRPVGCTAKFSETPLERKLMVEKLTFNSRATALVDIPAVSMPIARSHKTCDICGIVLCNKTAHLTFTFMHLADAFIQSDLQCIRAIHFVSMCVPWELNPQPYLLLMQCSTTQPQEHHFRVAFYCGQPKAHLCNNHAV